MKTLTLYKAYLLAREEAEIRSEVRPKKNYGIMVDQDEHAVMYRRYERLVRKLHKRLIKRLENLP